MLHAKCDHWAMPEPAGMVRKGESFPRGEITRAKQKARKSWWWRRNCRNEKERGENDQVR